MENIEEKVIQKIEEILSDFFTEDLDSKPEVKPDSNLREQLRFDELALVELTLWLEHKFKLEIYDDDLEQVFTVQDLIELIQSRI